MELPAQNFSAKFSGFPILIRAWSIFFLGKMCVTNSISDNLLIIKQIVNSTMMGQCDNSNIIQGS